MSPQGQPVYRVAKIPGDGIGPEIVDASLTVLGAAQQRFGFAIEWTEVLAGGIAIDAYGTSIRDEDLDILLASDAVLLGAVGGPKWDDPMAAVRPEQGLLKMRKVMGLYANLRPVAVEPSLKEASPLRADLIEGVDMMIVRELTGGIYFGKREEAFDGPNGREAYDTMSYTEPEIRRIVALAFELARGRRKKLTSVDKANVLANSRLWRAVVEEMAPDYPDIELEHRLVDFDRHVADHQAGRLRCHRHRQHVRRHPVRRSVGAGRLPGHAALRFTRGAQDGTWHHWHVRTDPWLVPRQDWPRHRQPHRHHPLGSPDAALVAGPGGCC